MTQTPDTAVQLAVLLGGAAEAQEPKDGQGQQGESPSQPANNHQQVRKAKTAPKKSFEHKVLEGLNNTTDGLNTVSEQVDVEVQKLGLRMDRLEDQVGQPAWFDVLGLLLLLVACGLLGGLFWRLRGFGEGLDELEAALGAIGKKLAAHDRASVEARRNQGATSQGPAVEELRALNKRIGRLGQDLVKLQAAVAATRAPSRAGSTGPQDPHVGYPATVAPQATPPGPADGETGESLVPLASELASQFAAGLPHDTEERARAFLDRRGRPDLTVRWFSDPSEPILFVSDGRAAHVLVALGGRVTRELRAYFTHVSGAGDFVGWRRMVRPCVLDARGQNIVSKGLLD